MKLKISFVFFLFAFVWTAGIGFGQQNATEVLTEGITLPQGTVIPIVLADYLNTRNSQVGDVFYADTVYPIWIQQKLVIPKGSNIRGSVMEVTRPGRIKGKGRLTIRFDDVLLPNGVRHTLNAALRGTHGPGEETIDRRSESIEGSGSAGEDVGTIVGTAASGTLLGTVIGIGPGRPGAGSAIGAGVGVAAGVAQVLFSRGPDLVINPGTRFDLELRQPMEFAFNELEFTDSQISSAGRNIKKTPAVRTQSPRGGGAQGGGMPRLGRIGVPGVLF